MKWNNRINAFFLLAFFTMPGIRAQHIFHIQGCIKNLPFPKVYLSEVYAGRPKLIDSAVVNNGCFVLSENDTLHQGLYYLILNMQQNNFFQLILNREDLVLHSDFSNVQENMEIEQSTENKLLYDYIKQTLQGNRRINELGQKGTLSKTDETEVSMLNDKNAWLSQYIREKYPRTLLASLLKAELPVLYPQDLPEHERKHYLAAHFFDHVDLDNPGLARTNLLSSMMTQYLALFQNQGSSFGEQVENYALASDSMLNHVKDHPFIHDFFQKELADHFRYGDYDQVCAYIEEYFKKDACTSDSRTSSVKERLAAMKHASVGTKAPEINMPTFDGHSLKLSDIPSEYVLLVFWSTYCAHCVEVVPRIRQIYDHRKTDKLEVLAISMDMDEKSWKDFVQTKNLDWLNYCDLKGWEGEIPKTYNVQGTPTFILVNKDRTIIAKPVTLEALATKLKELNLF